MTEAPTPRSVVAFFDFACPLCYIERPRLLRLRAEHGVVLDFIPFELRPEIPARVSPEEIGAVHSDRVEEYIAKVAEESGLPLVAPSFVPNSHRALSLAELARDAGAEYYEQMHDAIFRAYLGEGLDISDPEVLISLALDQGFDAAQVSEAFEERRYDERLAALRAYALEIGVTATPSTIICDLLVVGSRPYGVLEQVLHTCEIEPLLDQGEAPVSVSAETQASANGHPPATGAEG